MATATKGTWNGQDAVVCDFQSPGFVRASCPHFSGALPEVQGVKPDGTTYTFFGPTQPGSTQTPVPPGKTYVIASNNGSALSMPELLSSIGVDTYQTRVTKGAESATIDIYISSGGDDDPGE